MIESQLIWTAVVGAPQVGSAGVRSVLEAPGWREAGWHTKSPSPPGIHKSLAWRRRHHPKVLADCFPLVAQSLVCDRFILGLVQEGNPASPRDHHQQHPRQQPALAHDERAMASSSMGLLPQRKTGSVNVLLVAASYPDSLNGRTRFGFSTRICWIASSLTPLFLSLGTIFSRMCP